MTLAAVALKVDGRPGADGAHGGAGGPVAGPDVHGHREVAWVDREEEGSGRGRGLPGALPLQAGAGLHPLTHLRSLRVQTCLLPQTRATPPPSRYYRPPLSVYNRPLDQSHASFKSPPRLLPWTTPEPPASDQGHREHASPVPLPLGLPRLHISIPGHPTIPAPHQCSSGRCPGNRRSGPGGTGLVGTSQGSSLRGGSPSRHSTRCH